MPLKKTDSENARSEKLCCVCFKEEYNCVFIPCGHLCCCMNCGKKVYELNHKCPLCKKTIDKCQKTYKA